MLTDETAHDLTFRYFVDPAEYVRAMSAMSQWNPWRFLSIGVILFAAIPIIMNGVTGNRAWLQPGIAFTFLGLTVFALLLYGPWGRRWQIRRTITSSPLLREEMSLRFSDDGLTTGAGPASSHLKWAGILRVRESGEFYFVFYSLKCAYYLPKRLFRDADQEQAFRALIRASAQDSGSFLAREPVITVAAT